MEPPPIEYEERRSARARKVGLTIYPDCRVVVTVPRDAGPDEASALVKRYADWITGQLKRLAGQRDCVFLPRGRRDYLKHKERARSFAHSCLAYHNVRYGFVYGRISIKNQKSSWGSCSVRGNLNYNYRIVHLPARLAEYIIVHELCHLSEFNHSKRFWALVAAAIPDHKERRKALRKYLM